MIRLKNLHKTDAEITGDLFVEDSLRPVRVRLRVPDGGFEHGELPAGYEWCRAHLRHAQNALRSMADAGETPAEKTVMWY